MAASSSAPVVLGPLHVSCFVTAANRATPVFDVQAERKCVRVVTKASPPAVHSDISTSLASPSTTSTATTTASVSATGGNDPPSVEWDFHAVFAAATHGSSFSREVTLPALRSVVVDGVNANILATGVHPTQKFRFLFGKSTSTPTMTPTASPPDEKDVLELHGQLGALLFEFFHRVADTPRQLADWSLALSSWILVNNEAVDLLKPSQPDETGASNRPPQPKSLSFISIETASFETALQTLQTAKTHRIVRKHTAEHSHFFVRLAFFHRPSGRLSTLHIVDLMDLKDFRDDAVSTQEKTEFYEILHEIRQQTSAMAARAMASGGATTPHASPKLPRPPSDSTKRMMLLSNFVQPLLTQNAKTFLYANVIDSRASLRESVALLNAVANVKGFACMCKRLAGIEYEQLGFQPPPVPPPVANTQEALDSAAAKAMAAVAIGESLLQRLSSGSSSAGALQVLPSPLPVAESMAMESPVVTSDAMSWLESFKQRKKEILATATTMPPLAPSTSTRSVAVFDELPLGLSDANALRVPAPASTRSSSTAGSSGDLYARLMETIEQAATATLPSSTTTSTPATTSSATLTSMRMQLRRSNSMPLPIEDTADDMLPPPPLPQPQPPLSQDIAARLAERLAIGGTALGATGGSEQAVGFVLSTARHSPTLGMIGLPSQAMAAPNVDGLDAATAAKIQATDAALLRKNYDALLTVVREQQQAREAAETRAAEVAHDHEELRAQYDVQIENLKLEAVALKSKVRALERQSGVHHVFDMYERELQSLQRELQQLRMQNVELELRLVSTAPTAGSITESLSGGSGAGSLTELKKRYEAMARDKLELERQLAELRKKERQFHAQSKLIHESTRRVDRLSRELVEREDALTSTRLGKKRLSAEVAIAQQETQQLQQENEQLLLDKAATTEELLAAKMYLASVESEQKKAEILDKFVRKHGDRMQRLRGRNEGNNSSGSWVDPESWRRDAQAREAEEKLFQGVKRSVPQLVPLANKVLRMLELQELSLREFAEREVDFINLLVELASDQPARALKSMIDEEMQKLSLF